MEFGRKYLCVQLLVLIFANGMCSYRVQTDKDAVAYLTYYGYVNPDEMPQGFTLKDCNKKLMEFQKFARVDVTGKLDTPTMKAMNSPRCGCPDFINASFRSNNKSASLYPTTTKIPYHRQHHHHHNHHSHSNHHDHNTSSSGTGRHSMTPRNKRFKRYTLSESKWNKEILTYSIVTYPSRGNLRISRRDVEDTIHQAFKIWEQHINLQFDYRPNDIDVDIEIAFASTYHGDGYPFDGPGQTLAHAFFPPNGNIHIDEDENWTINSYSGVNLLFAAVHELGHSLGLGHSATDAAIMYPIYRGYSPNLELHIDDIRAAQTLYGRRAENVSPPEISTTTIRTSTTSFRPVINASTTRKTDRPRPGFDKYHLCENPIIDGITTMFGDSVLVFQRSQVYGVGMNEEGILAGWPKQISTYFKGLEGELDCVLTRSNGKTYFFKGKKYWRYTGREMDRGYPRLIAEYFPGIPDDLDAAFEWDNEFVFIKHKQFWRFNTRQRPQVKSFFPMQIDHWGLHTGINAAFTAPNSSVYLFQGPYFWEFNKLTHKINLTKYSGASLSSESWFGCTSDEP